MQSNENSTAQYTADKAVRIAALASHMDCDPMEIKSIPGGNGNTFSWDSSSKEFLVLTDDEADKYTAEYIEQTLCFFNVDFICDAIGVDGAAERRGVEKLLDAGEDSNALIKRMIPDFDAFVSKAVALDGRGHFLSSWNGQEHQVKHDGVYWYIYEN